MNGLKIFCFSIVGLFCFVMLSIGITTTAKSIEACNWPSTMGTIDLLSLFVGKNGGTEVKKADYDSSL
jgi:hypothetical protein